MLDKQKVFTKVKNHLLKQNQDSFNKETGTCTYRIKENGKILKCAIGCLISKKNYDPSIEDIALWELYETKNCRKQRPEKEVKSYKQLKVFKTLLELELKTKLNKKDLVFLNDLQQI